jgi:adenosylcobyric acid synthase
MEPQERARVRGVLINRFRGDPQLFEDGKQWLEDYTGIPVLGVIPYIPNLAIAEEDSLAFTNLPDPTQRMQNTPLLRIGILHLPHLANFTDFDPLSQEPDVEVVWIKHPDEMEQLDAVIIPGSKSTLYDLTWLIEQRLDLALQHHRDNGGFVLGICGGFQMMGARLEDPDQVESSVTSMLGLGMFTMTTVMTHKKATRWVDAHAMGVYAGLPIKGYEMHMGMTRWLQEEGSPFAHLQSASADVTPDGAMSADGRLIGTYLHHLFHNDEFRLRWINHLLEAKGSHPLVSTRSYFQIEEEAIAHLANVVKANVDMQQLFEWAGMGQAVNR